MTAKLFAVAPNLDLLHHRNEILESPLVALQILSIMHSELRELGPHLRHS
jgi:hypothetical protein